MSAKVSGEPISVKTRFLLYGKLMPNSHGTWSENGIANTPFSKKKRSYRLSVSVTNIVASAMFTGAHGDVAL